MQCKSEQEEEWPSTQCREINVAPEEERLTTPDIEELFIWRDEKKLYAAVQKRVILVKMQESSNLAVKCLLSQLDCGSKVHDCVTTLILLCNWLWDAIFFNITV